MKSVETFKFCGSFCCDVSCNCTVASIYVNWQLKNSSFNLFQIQIRGFLSHIQQVRIGYWGLSSFKAQSTLSHGLPSPRPKDAINEDQQPAEATGVGRSWVQSMFSRGPSTRNSFSRVRRWTSDSGSSGMCFINFRFALLSIIKIYLYIIMSYCLL